MDSQSYRKSSEELQKSSKGHTGNLSSSFSRNKNWRTNKKPVLEPMKKPNTTDYVNLSFRISAKQADKAKKALISIGAEELKESIYWEDIFPDFGPSVALRGSRKRECMTQKELADQIGVKQVHISQMENEKRPIGKAMAKRLANVLNVDYRIFL